MNYHRQKNRADEHSMLSSHLERLDRRPRGTGQEWFLTHLKFLDSTVELLDLKIHPPSDESDDD